MQLERRGIATASIITSGFVKAAQTHRRMLKEPDLPYLVVPHPIVSMSGEGLREAADAIFDEMCMAITRHAGTSAR